jgi:hypothetical protein
MCGVLLSVLYISIYLFSKPIKLNSMREKNMLWCLFLCFTLYIMVLFAHQPVIFITLMVAIIALLIILLIVTLAGY